MKKSINGPSWKKGTVLGHDRFDVQEPADPEAHLTEEQKKWPLVGGWDDEPGGEGDPASGAGIGEQTPSPNPTT